MRRLAATARNNRALLAEAARAWPSAMFGFGFALVPLYEVICEVTGHPQPDRSPTPAGQHAGRY